MDGFSEKARIDRLLKNFRSEFQNDRNIMQDYVKKSSTKIWTRLLGARECEFAI